METLKIGILIRDIEKLGNWEYRILKGIIEHPNLELSLFIKDGRKQTHSPKNRINSSSNVLWAVQMKLESLLFQKKKTVDSNEIIAKLKNTETIYLNPTREGFLDIFSEEDSQKVKAYNLDIILRHEFSVIRGDILSAARHGIWSCRHAENSANRGGPAGFWEAGFWEIVNNEPCCGVTLQQLTPEPDGGRIIEKARFNWHWSVSRNNDELSEKSVVLLFKNIEKLLKYGKIETENARDPHSLDYSRLYRSPSTKYTLIYIFKFYSTVFNRLSRKLFPVKRANCWALFFGKGNFLEAVLFGAKPVSMPRKVFWADPFLCEHENQLYVFFESYSYKKKKGKICVGKIARANNGAYSLDGVQDVLDFDYHLSYPQIVNEEGQLFLIPETGQNRRLEVYRCASFPEKWELYSTAFEGEEIKDTTYFQDENGDRWLFLNKGLKPHESEMHIYKIDSLKLKNITAHSLNPVLIDCRKGRNGGAIFKYENEYYRPSQINTHGIYGKGLQISKIKKLTLDEFEDVPVIAVEPNFLKGLKGIHHLHQLGDNYVFDACFKRF